MSDIVFTNEMDEEMTLNMGPHHPSTHGVLRFIISSDGEIIRKAVPDVGYLHRSIEKIGERCTYPGYRIVIELPVILRSAVPIIDVRLVPHLEVPLLDSLPSITLHQVRR